MKPAFFKEVSLVRDIPEAGLRAGDVATPVDYAPHAAGGEEGAVLELFNAIGESVAVFVVQFPAFPRWTPNTQRGLQQRPCCT